MWSCKQLERAVIFRTDEARKNKLDKQDLLPPFWKHLQPKKKRRCRVRFLVNSSELRDYHLTGVVTCMAELVNN